MAAISSTEESAPLGLTLERRCLLTEIALRSIEHGLQHGRALPVRIDEFDAPLRVPRASFVTLKKRGELRGCIGAIAAVRPLVEDVAHNAFAAAFEDPRFPGLRAAELPELEVHLSVLSQPEPIHFRDEADLVARIRPGVDGLILTQGPHRGTFLPSVWEQLRDPREFLAHLKLKAGLPADYWSDAIRVQRYTTTAW
jgi:AmmeMemoRadiSam system protein A